MCVRDRALLQRTRLSAPIRAEEAQYQNGAVLSDELLVSGQFSRLQPLACEWRCHRRCCCHASWMLPFPWSVASPGFVARRGKDGNYVIGHSQWTSGPGAAAARWLILLWLLQYWSKELWVVDICNS